MFEGDHNGEEKASQELNNKYDQGSEDNTHNAGMTHAFHLRTASCGVETRELLKKLLAMSTQVLGPSYAIKLQDANCGKEAMGLLTKLLATSKQIEGGSDHNITKDIVLAFERVVAECKAANQA
jgi:hypothetical protein